MKQVIITTFLCCCITFTLHAQEETSEVVYDGTSYGFIFQWGKKTDETIVFKRTEDAHWAGFGIQLLGYDASNHPEARLKNGSPISYSLNFVDWSHTFKNTRLMFVSGLGIEWNRFYLSRNVGLASIDAKAVFQPAPESINYTSSKYLVNYITVPILLEYQFSRKFYISGGIEGLFNCFSRSYVEYEDNGREVEKRLSKDFEIRKLNFRLRAQIGLGCVSAIATYTPVSMFHDGPDLHPYGFGIGIGF
jgi:hypothetical protein